MLVVCGCSGGSQQRQKVFGAVSFAGSPLADGSIEFFTTSGPAAGALVREGEYAIPAEHGLVPGVYRVTIRSPVVVGEAKPDGMSSPATRDRIPERYNAKTQLKAEVQANGANRFDFILEP